MKVLKLQEMDKAGRQTGPWKNTRSMRCPRCHRSFKREERILLHESYDDTFAVHLACLAEYLRNEPEFLDPQVVETEFDALRSQLLAAHVQPLTN